MHIEGKVVYQQSWKSAFIGFEGGKWCEGNAKSAEGNETVFWGGTKSSCSETTKISHATNSYANFGKGYL